MSSHGKAGCVVAVATALLISACSGKTTGVTNLSDTAATLNATATCDRGETCKWYWEYWRAGQPRSSSVKTQVYGPITGPTGAVQLSTQVTGLLPSKTYDWVFCGSPDGGAPGSYACVGPQGTIESVASDPPPDYDTFTTLPPGVSITEYRVPTANSKPQGITAGPDRALWFTESGANKIGRLTTGGTFTEHPVPTPASAPQGITAGADGALWFTESAAYVHAGANQIGRISTTGSFIEYKTSGFSPDQIAPGSDGALWFTESIVQRGSENDQGIGRMATTGSYTEYAAPPLSVPTGITPGADGALWFTEYETNKIGRITTSGAITEYPIPTSGSGPVGITSGPDGALWFTESTGGSIGKIGRITTSGAITEYALPSGSPGEPSGITAGPDGTLWFTASTAIGRITTSGAITTYPIPSGCPASGIAAGPDGALWFTQPGCNYIGRIAAP